MREVVKNLDLYAPITQEGRIKSRSAYLTSPVVIQVRNPDSLVERHKVYFTFDSANREVVVAGQKYPLGSWVSTPYGNLRFLTNPNYDCNPCSESLFHFSGAFITL